MLYPVNCVKCNKVFFRPISRYNEAIKFNWKQYCSNKCQYEAKNKQVTFCCHRPGCGKTFKRGMGDFLKYGVSYCSSRCFALVSKKCVYCGKNFRRNKKYCSPDCQHKSQTIDKNLLFKALKNFVKLRGRIPLKREFPHYRAIRGRFGTWNNFIKTAGFTPNPVMFAKKYTANDGHKCDSLSEKIIDDWFYARNIDHKRSCPYPNDRGLTVDFKVGDYWVEFFGLSGEHKRYDELKSEKIELVKKYKLKFISVYPEDLFPTSKLEAVLNLAIKGE